MLEEVLIKHIAVEQSALIASYVGPSHIGHVLANIIDWKEDRDCHEAGHQSGLDPDWPVHGKVCKAQQRGPHGNCRLQGWPKVLQDTSPGAVVALDQVARTIGQCLAFCLRKVKDSTSGKKLSEEVLAIGIAKLGEKKKKKKKKKKIETDGKDDDTQHEHDDVKEGCKQEDDDSNHDHVEDEAAQIKEDGPSKKEVVKEAEPSKKRSGQGG